MYATPTVFYNSVPHLHRESKIHRLRGDFDDGFNDVDDYSLNDDDEVNLRNAKDAEIENYNSEGIGEEDEEQRQLHKSDTLYNMIDMLDIL